MNDVRKREASSLFLGDVVIFIFALWCALFVRHLELPSVHTYLLHLKPFLFLFAVWVVVFYISGLYEKHTLVFKSRLPMLILTVQVLNSLLAVLFFYLSPYFAIAPKTVLFIDLVVTFVLLVFWRRYLSEWLVSKKKQNALLVGAGDEITELREEVNGNSRYHFHFLSSLDLNEVLKMDFQKKVVKKVYDENISMVVIDLKNENIAPILPHLYDLLFLRIYFFNFYDVYENIFDRIPLSLVGHHWFLENISSGRRKMYDFLKRFMDVVIAFVLGVLSLALYPFVIIAIKLEDGGRVFIRQKRVGKNNRHIELLKFRTMHFDDGGDKNEGKKNGVTRVGKFLRKSRLDELPQLWNVVRGDISLIGPRPELPRLVKEYEASVPYYGVRHLLKPGLSGWAQTHHDEHPHHEVDVKETKRKLSYDLYYIKNRSLMLDLKITLQTIRTLLSQSGR